jgi:hypothetical protein
VHASLEGSVPYPSAGAKLEVSEGIEPSHNGFADRSARQSNAPLERVMGVEPN